LERVQTERTAPARLPSDTDSETILQALAHIDPACSRSEWVKIGMALGSHYGGGPEGEGFAVFDRWAAGELTGGECPEKYNADHQREQWPSFTKVGTTTLGSLFYAAMAGGWSPPAGIDTAAAFGGAAAATADVFDEFEKRINEQGCSTKHTDQLVHDIVATPFSVIQRAGLLAELGYHLKEAGLLTKGMKAQLDKAAGAPGSAARAPDGPAAQLDPLVDIRQIPLRPLARPETSHGCNAVAMHREVFGGRLAVVGGVLRWWSGREWQHMDGDTLDTLCFHALMPGKSTNTNVSGTKKGLYALSDRLPDAVRDRRVYFQNGVLDLSTGVTTAHDRANGNTGTLQVEHDPAAQCHAWHAFVTSIFGGEADGQDRAALLQEIMGWCLFKDDLNVQKSVALDGASRAGKGVVLEVLSALLGHGAAGTFSFCNLADGKTQSAFRTYDVMLDTEAKPPQRQTMHQATGFLNKVASNEDVSIQLLNTQDPWSGRLNAKMIIACNGIPTMIDDSGASANRFMVLKFTRSFEESPDRGLAFRLLQELPGIAVWAVDGGRRLIANGGRFTTPATTVEATADLRGSNQPLLEFLNDCAVMGPDQRCHATSVWEAYQMWAMGANVKTPTRNAFYKSLNQTLLGKGVTRHEALRIGPKSTTGYTGMLVQTPAERAETPQAAAHDLKTAGAFGPQPNLALVEK
jgi:P4 family phage/plasmid primase-like protien